MQLGRMDDVAGCRLIFDDVQKLQDFRDRFLTARFDHRLRNDKDKYDYIRVPKETGYRGIHDVYEYNVRSERGRSLAGLYVEIQYRTLVQHAWATAVEVVGLITGSQPKFQRGDRSVELELAYASEILARAHENLRGPCPDVPDSLLVQTFRRLDAGIGLMRKLRGLSAAHQEISARKNTILMFDEAGALDVSTFRNSSDALRALFDLEKRAPDRDIVLVRADRSEDVRLAFRNYFSDARDFIDLLDRGCTKLAQQRLRATIGR